MRLRFLILFTLGGLNLLFAKTPPTITFSQTRGCIPFQYTVNVKNNGFCNSPPSGPNFIIYTSTESFGGLSDTVYVKNFQVTSSGISNLTITCTVGQSTTLGIFSIEGLTNTSSPDFTLSSCQGQQVKVNLKNPVYDKYLVNWNDGSNTTVSGNPLPISPIGHTYSGVSLQNISVTGIYEYTVAGSGLVTCTNDSAASTNTYPTLTSPEVFQIEVNSLNTSLGGINLSFRRDEKLKYKVYRKNQFSTAYSQIEIIPNTIGGLTNIVKTLNYDSLNTFSNTYCYKIEAFDDCGNVEPKTSQLQNQLCTLPISGIADTLGNKITIGDYDRAPAGYVLTVNGSVALTTLLSTLGWKYTDENVICGLNYTYRVKVKTQFPLDSQISISAPISLIALKKSPLAVPQIAGFIATVGKTDEKITLSWDKPTVTGVKYNVYVEASPKNSSLVSLTDTYTYTFNPSTSTIAGKCYFVEAKNQCGTSNIVRACPPFLQAQKDNLEQNSIQFENAVTGDNTPVGGYILEIYRQGGGNTPYEVRPESGNSDVQNPIDKQSQVTVYRVIGFLPDGTEVRSNFVAVRQDVRIFMPTAFTPNGDNINDTYIPVGLFWVDFELTIYNRWGQTVFNSTDQNKGWDGGSYNPDLYHYVARVKDQFGEEITKKGTFQLIR